MARNNGRDGIPRIGRPDDAGDRSSPSHPFGGAYSNDPADSAAPDTGPVDIAAVRRDDAFIEALRGDGSVATDNADEYQLALLLASWRDEIVSPALPSGPDLDEVAAAVDHEIAAAGLRRKASARSRPSLLRPVAGAAAAISLILGGLVVFSYNSTPGDPLWSVKSVVFAEQAESTVAQIDTTSKLEQAEQLIAAGDVSAAQALLDGASDKTGSVVDQAQRTDLEAWLQRLTAELQAAIPALPPPVLDPSLSLPVLPAPGTVGVPSDNPLPSVTLAPAPVTTTEVVVPPPTTEPVTPPPTVPPVTQTTEPVPTVVREPSPTTASASGGSTGVDTSQPGVGITENGGQ